MDTNHPVTGSEPDRQYAIFRDYADQCGVRRAYQEFSTLRADHERMASSAIRYLAESGPQCHDPSVFTYATEHGHVRVILKWRGLRRGLAVCSVEADKAEQWHRQFTDAERWLSQRADLHRPEQSMQSHSDN